MRYLRRISNSTLGPTLDFMRILYMSMVRSKIGYACAVWYPCGNGRDGRINRGLINELETLQNDCLVKIAGVYKSTSRLCLLKELHLESIETFLWRVSTKFQIKELQSQGSEVLSTHPPPFGSSESSPGSNPSFPRLPDPYAKGHPYKLLETRAETIQAAAHVDFQRSPPPEKKGRQKRKKMPDIIEIYLQKISTRIESQKWNEYRRERMQKRNPEPVYLENWGYQSLSFYDGLSRAQSTMLLHCRTGFNGLKKYLFTCKVRSLISLTIKN